ncbi:hypothetical protein B5566_02670 [Mycobacterium sp. MHSD3]|nr:hypothetical protein B5566_02670 [Mycobacterium sp. MHSD3]
MADFLKHAKIQAGIADENFRVEAIAKSAVSRGTLYALIDIAESLRALANLPRPPLVSYAGLTDLPLLESDGGTDDADCKGDNG